MRVLLLGTGTCLNPPPGAVPRHPPLFAVELSTDPASPRWLLFDCSEGARLRLPGAGIDPSWVRYIALSHPHADHAALPQFLQGRACEAIFRQTPDLDLTLLLHPEPARALPDLWRWHQPEDEGRPSSRFSLDVRPVDDGDVLDLEPGVRLSAHRVHHGHGRSPALAFRLDVRGQVIAYSGDTGPCPGVLAAARNADLFLCEASCEIGRDMSAYGHLTPAQAGAIALEAGAQRLVLTHYTGLSPDRALLDDARSSGYAGALSVGHDGDDLRF